MEFRAAGTYGSVPPYSFFDDALIVNFGIGRVVLRKEDDGSVTVLAIENAEGEGREVARIDREGFVDALRHC